METVFVLEYFVYYEGGGIIGVFATEEAARKAFWREAKKEEYGELLGDAVAITSHMIGTSSLWNQKTVAQFERLEGGERWIEVTNDD